MFRVSLAQINPTVGALKANAQVIAARMDAAAELGADVVAFPELALCGYPPEDLLLKKAFVSKNLEVLASLARRARETAAIVGFVDRDKKTGELFNAAAILHRKKVKAVYRKHNLPNYGVFDERRYFSEGSDSGLFLLAGRCAGVSVCEDIWVENGICRKQGRAGARVLFNISSSPYNVGKLTERERLLRTRARETGSYVCYVNLVGGQDELVFDGGSMVFSPEGRRIAHARQFEEDLLTVDLDVPKSRKRKDAVAVSRFVATQAGERPELESDRPPRYSSTERIYKALVLGTRDYISKNGFRKVTIGLSGGVDSALVASVAVDALGADNVVGVTMPSRYSSAGTKSDALKLAENLGIQCLKIPIEEMFTSYLEALKVPFEGTMANEAEENIQARIRGNLLMALSNKFGWIVLTTGNKSELAVGYCTLYGDMSGGFAVIKDVPKTRVFELCRFRNEESARAGRDWIPETILTRPPSAELRENQRDQDSLPEYEILDAIVTGYVEDHQSYEKLARKFDPVVLQRVLSLIDRNEYKRRQGPPGIKITPRAFGKDWRLPITNRFKQF